MLSLVGFFANENITQLHITPSLLSLLNETSGGNILSETVKRVFVGGERLSVKAAKDILSMFPNSSLYNVYGATETPQLQSAFHVNNNAISRYSESSVDVPIGNGFGDNEISLINPAGEICAFGERGEIVIRSQYLAKGYLQ